MFVFEYSNIPPRAKKCECWIDHQTVNAFNLLLNIDDAAGWLVRPSGSSVPTPRQRLNHHHVHVLARLETLKDGRAIEEISTDRVAGYADNNKGQADSRPSLASADNSWVIPAFVNILATTHT